MGTFFHSGYDDKTPQKKHQRVRLARKAVGKIKQK